MGGSGNNVWNQAWGGFMNTFSNIVKGGSLEDWSKALSPTVNSLQSIAQSRDTLNAQEAQDALDKQKAIDDANAAKAEIARHNQAIEEYNQQALQQQEEASQMQEEYLGLQFTAYQDQANRLKEQQAKADAQAAADAEKLKRRLATGAGGRKSTILTGGLGSTGGSGKKTLLGQ
jgi:hypothetical protein